MPRPKLPRDAEGNIIREKSDGLETGAINTTGEALEIVKKEQDKIVEANSLYTASIKLWGKVTTATGATAIEAICNLKPEAKKGIAVLTVSRGEKSRTRLLNASQIFKLYAGSRLMREITIKNVSMLFSDV